MKKIVAKIKSEESQQPAQGWHLMPPPRTFMIGSDCAYLLGLILT